MRSERRIEFLEVVAVPRHEGDQHVAAERELAEIGRGTVGDDVALLDLVADLHQRALVDAGVLVRALELLQPVDVDAGFRRIGLAGGAHHDAGGVDLVDHPGAARRDRGARIAGDHALHAGADERRLGTHQRHRLALHVGAHQRAVGVVVLEERDQRRGHRDQLLGRHVHEVDLAGRHHLHVAGMPAHDHVLGEPALRVDGRIGLRHGVARLLHRREIDDLVGDAAVLHLAIGRLDKAVLVDPRERRQRVDETDIRSLRRLDRADAAIVGRVHVAHLEARPLAGQAARSERREPPLMGDLGQRIGLVHELGQLRGAEELAHRRRRRLGVDEVLRHHGVDIDRGHALLDGALHAQQADPILVLHQLADRAHPAVAEMVDVVDLALAVAQIDQRADHRDDVLLAEHAHRVGRIEVEPHVHLDAADRREVVALRIEEQRLEHRLGGIERRRLARTHHPVDVEQRILAGEVLVDHQRVADIGADIDMVDVEQRQLLVAGLDEQLEVLFGDLLAGLGIDLAGLHVHQVLGEVVTDQLQIGHAQRLEALLGELARLPHRQLLAGLEHDLAAVGVDQIVDRLVAAEAIGVERHAPAVLVALVVHLAVERVEDLLAVHAERKQERRHRDLPATVDARMDDVLGIELDVEPGAAIGNDAGGEQQLARGVRLALVVVEEHARRAVHLRHDHPLGAIDHEGAVHGHERDVAHVDVLLLDVLDRLGAGLLVDIEHDQAQRHLERSRIGHAALPALVDIVFGRLELVLDELEHRRVGKVRDREHGLEYGLQALVGPAADRFLHQQELVIGRLLNLDEVRHLCDFLDFPEKLTNALATCERLRHALSLTSSNRRDRDDSPEGRNPSRPSGQASSPRRSFMYDPARHRID